jgi:GAF domain-containing protein/HAMP domain-containing protein
MKSRNQNINIQLADEKLAEAFYSNGRYNALFLGITSVGFIVIYLLTRLKIFGEATPSLLYISGAILLLAISQIPLLQLARRKRGIVTNVLATAFVAIFAILLTAFWEGIVPVSILVTIIAPGLAIFAGLPRRHYLLFLLMVVAGIGGILYVNAYPPIDRLQSSTPAAVSSLAFLFTTGLLFVTITIIARSKNYQRLRTQLLVSFLIIVTVPTLLATLLSGVGAYVNSEAQIYSVLETVSDLKENQINDVINTFKVDVARINQDVTFVRNILEVLSSPEIDRDNLAVYGSLARNRLVEFKEIGDKPYEEILVMNLSGVVVISTEVTREGRNLQSELFFREGSTGEFAGFSHNPAFGNANLIFATPLYDTEGKIIRGILVLRANSKAIRDIMEATPALSEMETYLLEKSLENTLQGEEISLRPLTQTRTTPPTYNTQELLALLNSDNVEGNNLYENYAGEPVLGYYKHLDFLDSFIVAEVPRSYILRNSITSLLGSAALAVFAIIIAVAAAAISAASITEPISTLARTAQSFAQGKLSARAAIDRRDEIGALGNAYDQMAEQLQDIIGKLEQRVADRTKELQDQSLRLRTSAEIARDAASSHSLSELLERAVTLVQERFRLYHTGIFLLDKNNEYAILAASPTPAGKQMIANNHKLRVGEVGIVGRVAATAEPRITLDTGADAVYFNNPLLPKTRSEMALPLKVENRMIGVLDVQSDQPQAFDENDVAIMQILADQLATAIERARLLQQVEQNLSDLEQVYGQFTRESWKTLGEAGLLSKAGYRFDNVRIQSITEVSTLGDRALQTGTILIDNAKNGSSASNQVAIPIKLRGQTIGVVTANLKDGYSPLAVSTLELSIERLALSLESARLYEEARLRADRERTIAQVTSNISSATEFDAILRTTVEEIGKSLGDATEVSIQIISDTDQGTN